jgi:uncharacterized protein
MLLVCRRMEGHMEYNVAQMLLEPIGSVRQFEIQETFVALDDVEVNRLEGWLKLTRTDIGIWVKGRLKLEVSSQCGRCLKGFNAPLNTEINEQYYPAVELTTGAAIAAPVLEEEAFRIGPTNVLDTREALRQNIVSRMPMKPLCHQDCAGICPECGVDRNEAQCLCVVRTVDPRWERLLELLPSTDKGSLEGADSGRTT